MMNIFLYIHIAAGMTALLLGLVAMLAPKGQRVHNRAGLIYFWCMMVIALTSTILSLGGPRINWFLLLVGVFSFYLTFTGYRSTKIKHHAPQFIDKFVTGSMLLAILGMIVLGTYSYFNNAVGLTIILGVFGGIGSLLAISDVIRYRDGMHHPKVWLLDHLGRMCGAYIATFTAFVVTNIPQWLNRTDLNIYLWTMPAILGGLGIGLATNYYQKKYNIPKKGAETSN